MNQAVNLIELTLKFKNFLSYDICKNIHNVLSYFNNDTAQKLIN